MPESPRWTERAPEREAEQRKLEEKRRAVMEKMEKNRENAGWSVKTIPCFHARFSAEEGEPWKMAVSGSCSDGLR